MSGFWQVPSAIVVVMTWLTIPPTSLGDVARREALRRELLPKATLTLTNLGRPVDQEPPSSVTLPPPPDAEPPATTDPAKADPEKPDASKGEQWWRERIAKAREAINNGVATEAAIETRINKLQTDAVNLDDPLQRARARTDLEAALAELKATRDLTEQARRELANIQEEARRLNVPPGWIR